MRRYDLSGVVPGGSGSRGYRVKVEDILPRVYATHTAVYSTLFKTIAVILASD